MKLIYLSKKFYADHAACNELLMKQGRPYACVVVKTSTHEFAIPFRHHISHKHAFITRGQCGLDYSKAIPILDAEFVGNGTPRIDSADYSKVKGKEKIISAGMERYIQTYKKAKEHKESPFYKNILSCSSLQYFEEYI